MYIRRRKKMFSLLGTTLIALVVLAACTGSARPEATVTPVEAGASSAEAAPASSSSEDTVPDFKLIAYQGQQVLGGEEVQFSELLGQGKPVVLNFWAGLCPPCRLEMPDLEEVHNEYQDDILLVGVDIGAFVGLGSPEEGQALLQDLEVTYPAGTTPEADIVQDYRVVGMPSTYFITPEGEIVTTWTGLLNKEKLTELIAELIEASKQS